MWQDVAARTGGLVTPGNVITIVGFVVSLLGLVLISGGFYWLGLLVVAMGRLCDVLDGMVAEYTHTKSPFGEMLDASIDKIITVATLVALLVFGIVPWPVAALVFLPNVSNTMLTVAAQSRGVRLHPSKDGKLAMAFGWVSLLGFILAAAEQNYTNGLSTVSYALGIVSFIYGVRSTAGYLRELKR